MSTAPGTAVRTMAAIVASLWTGASGWMSTTQVAARLGYSRQRVHQLIMAGEIPAQRLGPNSKWRIPLEWVRQHLTANVIRRKPDQSG